MTAHAHYSKAAIGGHPVHPMLVGFPIAFYTAGVAGLLVYARTHDLFWHRGAMIAMVAGVAMALLAAVFGFVDLFFGVPRDTAPRRTGIKHFILNVVTVVLFAGAAFMLHRGSSYTVPLILGIVGLGLTVVAGVLGWKLVQTHHVGIDEHTGAGDMFHRGGTA